MQPYYCLQALCTLSNCSPFFQFALHILKTLILIIYFVCVRVSFQVVISQSLSISSYQCLNLLSQLAKIFFFYFPTPNPTHFISMSSLQTCFILLFISINLSVMNRHLSKFLRLNFKVKSAGSDPYVDNNINQFEIYTAKERIEKM